MKQLVSTTENLTPNPRIRPERLAWGVLLGAFVIFCIVCIASTVGVYFFLFQSTISMSSPMLVGRGTVTVTTKTDPIGRSVRDGYPTYLLSGTDVSTDSQSQATISFRDSQGSGRLLATLTLKLNTSIELRSATLPRFGWATTRPEIVLANFSGEVDVFVPENVQDNFTLSIQTPLGNWVSLTQNGSYIVSASDTQLRVINRAGTAVLFAADPQYNRAIPAETQGIVQANSTEITLIPAYVNLLANSTFEEILAENADTTQILPLRWGCTNEQDALPGGSYRLETLDGRMTMRLLRADGASSHGETRCLQAYPSQTGLDVRNYNYLVLRATFYVNYQSLNICGIDGSECPMMLRMDYLDPQGNPQTPWFHGFYTRFNPQFTDPFRCSSCTQDHESIYEKAWYTYDSGNLVDQFPPDKKLGAILNIQFYASGHQYDVYISEVSLLAGTN